MDNDNITNNSRNLKEISAYVILFAKLKLEERILEVMGWKEYANFIEKASLTKRVTSSQ
jgi:hypothetical protein